MRASAWRAASIATTTDYPADSSNRSFAFSERRGAEVVQAAGDWILQEGAAAPWLAWVHLFDPHTPHDAPPEYGAGRTPYEAEVAYADAMVGRLLDRLGGAVLARTLVVVTADHGESLGDHGETTHGLFAYDATIAVPLIVSGGGVGHGVIEAPAGHDDILPTIADLVGVAAPAGIDGQSTARPLPSDRVIYIEALDASLTRNWAPLTGVVTRDWKYIHLPAVELYARRADPGERRNLAETDPSRTVAFERSRLQLTSAPATPAPAAPLDAAAERRLRALGYVGAAAAPGGGGRTYAEADDPKRLVELSERFNTALTSFTEGRSAEALEAFSAVLTQRPDFTTARTSAATVLLAGGRAAAAVALLRAAPPQAAGAAEIQAKLGAALRESGDLRGAATALERARADGYANPELLNDLGAVYAQLGRVAEARTEFTALLALDPDAADVWHNLGVLEMTARQPAAAAVAFRHAVDVDPSRGDAWEGLGAALLDSDRVAAVEAWRRAERLAPGNFDLLFNLGLVLADGPTPRAAVPYLTRFLREAPPARYAADPGAGRGAAAEHRPMMPPRRLAPGGTPGVAQTAAAAALVLVLGMAACRGGDGPPTAPAAAPLHGANVLLVTIDTLRADHVGAYGAPAGRTPTLDRLAAEGLRVETVYAHVPLTLPSHTAVMTATYPFVNGVRDNGSFRFDGSRPTLAGTLKAAGYRTAAFVSALRPRRPLRV